MRFLEARAVWPAIGVARHVSELTWSRERQDRVRQLLANCARSHAKCAYKPLSLPTRVIDVGSEDEEPRLHVPRSDEQPAEYTTLSHCWGGSRPIETNTKNVQERKNRIPLAQLPKTFKDAVIVTRSLGVRYLWIDSLCILQDSQEDWEREASRMSTVYSNCYLMIAADHSGSCHGGCFKDGPPRSPRLGSASTLGLGGRPCRVFFRITNERDAGHSEVCHRLHQPSPKHVRSPLNERGWTLQERVLAPRILHFGESEMAWECLEMLACECQSVTTEFDRESRFKNEHAIEASSRSHSLWPNLVEEFSRRRLTRDTDILEAVSGLASRLNGGASATEYFAGMWRNKLVEALLWKPDYPYISVLIREKGTSETSLSPSLSTSLPTDSAYLATIPRRHHERCAPSWSWASIVGPIWYSETASTSFTTWRWEKILPPLRGSGSSRNDIELSEVIHITYQRSEHNPFGRPKNSVLTLRGPIAEVTFEGKDKDQARRNTAPRNQGILLSLTEAGVRGSGQAMAKFEPDLPDSRAEVGVGDELLLLWIREDFTEEASWKSRAEGLVLQRQQYQALPLSYRRVGTFRYEKDRNRVVWEAWRKLRRVETVHLL